MAILRDKNKPRMEEYIPYVGEKIYNLDEFVEENKRHRSLSSIWMKLYRSYNFKEIDEAFKRHGVPK